MNGKSEAAKTYNQRSCEVKVKSMQITLRAIY
jgi:hypothetical protein